MRRMSFLGGNKPEAGSNVDEKSIADEEDIVRAGYLKKLKTNKRKYFILRSGNGDKSQARLEYYDNDKKWRAGEKPKKSINIRSCFDINRKHDAKGRFVLALYTPNDSFALVCASQEEFDQWLTELLRLQQDGHIPADFKPRPNFDHIWEVSVKQKSLGSKKNIHGEHRLCLTPRFLKLMPFDRDSVRGQSNSSLVEENNHEPAGLEFALNSIRRCGHTDFFFYMELGRASVTGSGELWMQTDDTVIAQNMHEVILGAMKENKLVEDAPRSRSSSISENTNPMRIPSRAIMGSANFHPKHSSPLNGQSSNSQFAMPPRDRCDSLPSRQTSESSFDHAVPTRCNTMDCTQMGPQTPHGWSGSSSPLAQMHNHSSLESCAEEGHPHSTQAQRSHLHINISHNLDSHQTIVEEQDGNTEYLTMNSPGQAPSSSLMPSPSTLADGGSTSLSSGRQLSQQSSVSSSDYMKMSPTHDGSHHSRSGSSAIVNNNNNNPVDSSYMSMSPVGNNMASANVSAALANGYVPMMISTATKPVAENPPFSPPGYMEMAPLSSSLPKSVSGFTGSWGSSIHSLHEASPTFELNMEEFHLDKVKSYITPSGDEENSIRTGRSFSVGKRPQAERLTNERVRAYSVGSQVYPAALAAKKRQQQMQQKQESLGSPRTDRSNSYSKKSSSTTTLGGSSRHSEEFMEINYDENWHRATSAAAAAGAAAVAAAQNMNLPPPCAPVGNNNSNTDSDYLPMGRVAYKEPESKKLLPVREVEVPAQKKESDYMEHSFFPAKTRTSMNRAIMIGPNSEYMDITCGPPSPLQSVPQSQSTRPLSSESDGDYVSLDISRPWNTRISSNPLTGGPEPKKCKSEIQSHDVPMTTQHNYENLSFGANGATVENVSSQEPMETDSKSLQNTSSGSSSQTTVPTLSLSSGLNHELNYASLDLPPPSDEVVANRPITGTMELGGNTSPAPGVSYSEVDFRKSDGLRGSMMREGGRV